jgi:4-diphosphocytidyl-2-C-methyl-D-erythritol kinase
MIVEAHAKVNLTLEVLGKRGDGYHELCSIMRLLALHDTLRVEPSDDVEVLCDVEGLGGSQNLAFTAVELLRRETRCPAGIRVTLAKQIPVAAGLGGGSSDAAAALSAANTVWGTGLGLEELSALAAVIGSDVPYFLRGGTALARGRGEVLRPLPPQPICSVLLVNPGFGVSTAAIYGGVTPALYASGRISAAFAGLAPGTAPHLWPLANTLQTVTTALHPVIGEIVERLHAWGAVQALMCGSGPTCFGLFEDSERCATAARNAEAAGWRAWRTKFA